MGKSYKRWKRRQKAKTTDSPSAAPEETQKQPTAPKRSAKPATTKKGWQR